MQQYQVSSNCFEFLQVLLKHTVDVVDVGARLTWLIK